MIIIIVFIIIIIVLVVGGERGGKLGGKVQVLLIENIQTVNGNIHTICWVAVID